MQEDRRDADVRAEPARDQVDQPHDGQRAAAQVEEAVVRPDPVPAQHGGEQPGQDGRDGTGRGGGFGASRWSGDGIAGCGQGPFVNFPAGVEGELGDRYEARRDHVTRQRAGQVRAHLGQAGRGAGFRAGRGPDVGAELLVPGRIGDHGDHGLGDGGVGGQGGLDLAQLDAQAADLDLAVGPAQEHDRAVGPAADQVAGLVQPGPRPGPERVGDEPFPGQLGPVQVAAGHAGPAEVQLAGDADRDRVQVRVQHVGLVVGPYRAADRRRELGAGVQLHERGADRDLGRAVVVHEPRAGPRGPAAGQLRRQLLAPAHQHPQRRELPVAEQGDHRRGQAGERDVPVPHQGGQPGRRVQRAGRGEHHPAAAQQGHEHVLHGGVEAQRGELEHDVGRADVPVRDHAVQQVDQVPVLHHDALGPAGRARRVDHVSHVAGGWRRSRGRCRPAWRCVAARPQDQ